MCVRVCVVSCGRHYMLRCRGLVGARLRQGCVIPMNEERQAMLVYSCRA